MATSLPSSERWGSLEGKRVLVRVDFNTPVTVVDGVVTVTDDFRIRSTIPLFESLLRLGATVVACTHFGRPKGKVVPEYSVEPVRRRREREEYECDVVAARGRRGVDEEPVEDGDERETGDGDHIGHREHIATVTDRQVLRRHRSPAPRRHHQRLIR